MMTPFERPPLALPHPRPLVLVDDENGVDDAGNVAEKRQKYVDEKVFVAARLDKDSKGREQDGEDHFEDVLDRDPSSGRRVDSDYWLHCHLEISISSKSLLDFNSVNFPRVCSNFQVFS